MVDIDLEGVSGLVRKDFGSGVVWIDVGSHVSMKQIDFAAVAAPAERSSCKWGSAMPTCVPLRSMNIDALYDTNAKQWIGFEMELHINRKEWLGGRTEDSRLLFSHAA